MESRCDRSTMTSLSLSLPVSCFRYLLRARFLSRRRINGLGVQCFFLFYACAASEVVGVVLHQAMCMFVFFLLSPISACTCNGVCNFNAS